MLVIFPLPENNLWPLSYLLLWKFLGIDLSISTTSSEGLDATSID